MHMCVFGDRHAARFHKKTHSYMLLSGIACAGSERGMFTLNDEQHPVTFIIIFISLDFRFT